MIHCMQCGKDVPDSTAIRLDLVIPSADVNDKRWATINGDMCSVACMSAFVEGAARRIGREPSDFGIAPTAAESAR